MEQYKNALYRQESIILIYINIYLIYYMKVVLQVSSAVSDIDRHRKCHSLLFVLINLGIRTA